jgi:outer membrane murein-binding lipoprotein Lpp
MRVVPAVVGALLLVSACSSEAGPTPKRGAQDPGPEALRVKLEALTADACYTDPEKQNPPGCEKYVTQLGSVPATARGFAGTDGPELAAQADELATAITAYRSDSCYTPEGTGADACSAALMDIADALTGVKSELGAVLDSAATGTSPG